jgi:CheY-like chemotaxis protein/HPt (histidine-containing phosphotransfer) domain-containing protein
LGFAHVLPVKCGVDQALSVLSAFVREELPPPAFTAVLPESDIAELRALLSGRRVLVLEDNPMSRAVVQRQFNALGISLDLAENGRQGLEKVEANDYAVILSDCAMPEIDGYLFTQILRRRELGKGTHVPVIAMTANAGDDDAKKCLAAGMDDFMTKPVRLSSLAKMLGKWAGASKGLGVDDGSSKTTGLAVDLSLLSEILGVNTDADFDEALDLFVEYFPTFLAEAEEALVRGDFDAMGDSAHTAKGAARNAGALPLGEAMGRAETCAKARDAQGYRAALADANIAWDAVQAFVAGRLGTGEAAN